MRMLAAVGALILGLALVVAHAVVIALSETPLTADLTRWHAWRTGVVMVLIAAMILWGSATCWGGSRCSRSPRLTGRDREN